MRTLTMVLGLANGLFAQSVLQVGAGGYVQIADAIAAAAPGDIVQVATGTYQPFVCDKAITIAAEPSASVSIIPALALPLNPATEFIVPVGEMARVRGLNFQSLSFIQIGGQVEVLSGAVSMEECTFGGTLTIQQTLLVQNASLHMRACTAIAGDTAFPAHAVELIDASFAAVDCTFEGSALVPDGGIGAGDAINATNSTVHLNNCTVRGGDTMIFSCFYPAGDAVETDRGEWTWIADCELIGGTGPCGTGGAGLRVTNNQPASLARNAVQPGVIGPSQASYLIGYASAVPEPLIGVDFQFEYQTQPGAALLVFASLDLIANQVPGILEATWTPSNGYLLVGAATPDLAGIVPVSITVPPMPILRDVGVWLHAVDIAPSPWRTAVPIGGLLR